jgi:hypothetical protein
MDTKERYENNLKNNYEKLKQQGWIDYEPFTYNINSAGFRCDEFTDQPALVTFGCSITTGIGIPYESTWSYLIAKHLNLQNINLSVPGGSNDTAFRLAVAWLPKLNPKLVILNSTYPNRYELLDSKNEPLSFNNSSQPIGQDFYKEWVTNDNNGYLNKIKNIFALEAVCKQQNIKCLISDVDENLTTRRYPHQADLARDLAHPGILHNQMYSNALLEQI